MIVNILPKKKPPDRAYHFSFRISTINNN